MTKSIFITVILVSIFSLSEVSHAKEAEPCYWEMVDIDNLNYLYGQSCPSYWNYSYCKRISQALNAANNALVSCLEYGFYHQGPNPNDGDDTPPE
jgi:hypothetical protein